MNVPTQKALTPRQREVLVFIAEYLGNHGYAPTIREIAEDFSISVKGAYDHILALKRKGALKQEDNRPRTLEILRYGDVGIAGGAIAEIPLLGTVAAGRPIMAEENWDGSVKVHRSLLKNPGAYFALKVRGDSMEGAGIMDGDMAIVERQEVVRSGTIAVVQLAGRVTLKRFFRERSRIRLQAENPRYAPIYCTRDLRVLGRLATIIRSY
ncbi:MAG: transcriptional repressor LexA [Treponema sp.]|jgi:repressor LexA|nr:transcriptional repressor LexA [Treponema sp.]